ncbi:Uncharacterised protein [Sphingobacterium multivorum]|uniref:hypothetical protein n=1 Tax=Sphingobacterium multivorum TaxID=28454 RepID=UPI000E089E1F|nr:hypothetical protein [Sphingobacterium multivorum]QQT46079.1 hypothetical protein I6J00_05270 [Sphingobacterium multivorum]SUJ30805.1 Uncharacterised protein [Sphingobacterium multivorum]
MNENQLHILKLDIFSRAKLFIEEIGEFAPFGSEVIEGKINPVMYYDEPNKDGFIDSKEAVRVLKEQFSKGIKKKVIDAAAIAYDVAVNIKNSDGVSEKRDALCLEITEDGDNWDDEYFPYRIIDGQCVWR